jgi:hypothetical protein
MSTLSHSKGEGRRGFEGARRCVFGVDYHHQGQGRIFKSKQTLLAMYAALWPFLFFFFRK